MMKKYSYVGSLQYKVMLYKLQTRNSHNLICLPTVLASRSRHVYTGFGFYVQFYLLFTVINFLVFDMYIYSGSIENENNVNKPHLLS